MDQSQSYEPMIRLISVDRRRLASTRPVPAGRSQQGGSVSADETAVPAPTPPPPAANGGGTALSVDEQRLHDMGYAQELRRHMSGFSNFAVSFTIISILSGCLTLYGTGMNTGGAAPLTCGGAVVGVLCPLVALSLVGGCAPY